MLPCPDECEAGEEYEKKGESGEEWAQKRGLVKIPIKTIAALYHGLQISQPENNGQGGQVPLGVKPGKNLGCPKLGKNGNDKQGPKLGRNGNDKSRG